MKGGENIMSLKSVSVPVDPAWDALEATGIVNPIYQFQTEAERLAKAVKIQETGEDGLRSWEVEGRLVVENYGAKSTESIRVRMSSLTEPKVPLGPVRFIGLTLTARISKGQFAAYWAADGIETTAKPTRSGDHVTA
jgi:hypothetical protein